MNFKVHENEAVTERNKNTRKIETLNKLKIFYSVVQFFQKIITWGWKEKRFPEYKLFKRYGRTLMLPKF